MKARLKLPAELAMTGLALQPPLTGCTFSPAIAPGGTPGVTASCSTPDLPAGSSASFVVDARVLALPAGSAFDVRGEAGSLDCRDLVAGDSWRTCATGILPSPTLNLQTAGGDLFLQASAGTFLSVQPISPSLLPTPPAGVGFPYGGMSFTTHDVPVGGSVTIGVGASQALLGYWKLSAAGWTPYLNTQRVSGGLLITLVDGGAGDADGLANGVIVDPGAVGTANQPPVALDRSVTTPAGAPIRIDVLSGATDPDGGVPEVESATNGEKGSVEVTPGDVTYTSYEGMTGADSFTVAIGDGQGGRTTITVQVTIGGTDQSGGADRS
jgi:hypothetical protein